MRSGDIRGEVCAEQLTHTPVGGRRAARAGHVLTPQLVVCKEWAKGGYKGRTRL